MSEQNPPAAQVPEVPSPPQQSAGSDSPPGTAAALSPAVPTQPTADAPRETIGDAPRETIGDAPRETIGSAPQAAPQAAEAAPLPPATVEPAAKPRRRGIGLIVTAVLLALVLIAAGGYYFLVYRTNPARADVGDCLSGTENPAEVANVKLIDCGDKGATFKVTKKITNQPKDVNDTACAGIEHDDVYWYGPEGKNGTVLCLLKLNS